LISGPVNKEKQWRKRKKRSPKARKASGKVERKSYTFTRSSPHAPRMEVSGMSTSTKNMPTMFTRGLRFLQALAKIWKTFTSTWTITLAADRNRLKASQMVMKAKERHRLLAQAHNRKSKS